MIMTITLAKALMVTVANNLGPFLYFLSDSGSQNFCHYFSLCFKDSKFQGAQVS